jgi:hypothetical protein
MDLGENLGNSLEYAKKMAKDLGRWVLLIVLGVIPVVNWIVMGYWAKAVRETPASDEPPRLEGYGSMWTQGLKIIVAGIIYMIIPMVLMVIGVATAIPGVMRRPMAGLTTFPFLSGLALVMFAAAIVASFLIAIIAVLGIVHMVKQDRFTKAFAGKRNTRYNWEDRLGELPSMAHSIIRDIYDLQPYRRDTLRWMAHNLGLDALIPDIHC